MESRGSKGSAANDPQGRELFFDRAASLTPYLAVETRHGELYFIRTDGGSLGKLLFIRRRRKDSKALHKSIRVLDEYGLGVAGSTFVDVGANIGTTTVVALRQHPFARGIAFEPSPGNFQTLRLNLTANGLDGVVTAFEAAVSDEEGERALVLSGMSCGEHTLDPKRLQGTVAGTVTVKAVTLDGLVARGELDPADVGLLWVDAAGSEVDALMGASTLMEAGVPIVIAVREKIPSWPVARPAVVKALASYTDFALLRRTGERSNDVSSLLASLHGNSDMLAIRR